MNQLPERNRRMSRRFQPKRTRKAACLKGTWGLGRNIAMSVLDVSETGTRLLVKESLSPGQEVEVSLEGLQLQRPVKRQATVVWSLTAQDGTHLVGVRFEKLLGFDEMRCLTTT